MSIEQHINVFLVDDHLIIRDGVRALLHDVNYIHIVDEASNGLQALKLIRANPTAVDVVIMDITMPEMDGVETTEKILNEFPAIKILALSMHDDEQYIIKMLQLGALGYILKTTGRSELVTAISRVASGQSYFDREASAKLQGYFSHKKEPKRLAESKITAREKEVLLLIAEELTNTQIAKKLFLSPRTIDTHRRNLLQKLQVKNTAGLVKYAIEKDLLPTS